MKEFVKNDQGIVASKPLLEITSEPQLAQLGEHALRVDIRTSMGPFHYLPDYKTKYPETVIKSLSNLYVEYNQAFDPLVKSNREWDSDYQYAMRGSNSSPVNFLVQIDMMGLPDNYLKAAATMNIKDVQEDLRGRIFEIENSLAMYQLLIKIFAFQGQESRFGLKFRNQLDILRNLQKRPIALLAVTDQKYQAMRESEFGKQEGEPLSNKEIIEMSGFDAFFGPKEFLDHLSENNGKSEYLLYVRSSDPVSRLRNPNLEVENPLLSDGNLRKVIKENAITFNIDNPEWTTGDARKINDTKGYLPAMGMAIATYSEPDLDSDKLRELLIKRGITTSAIESGQVVLRAKPMQASYGCYGHLRSCDRKFRQELRRELRRRGPYVIQPEMATPIITNEDGRSYTYIDRNFFATDGINYTFMGGFRSLMPLDSIEAQKGRVHGNGSTVWAEIY